jgi:glycosyltransferase involved in cell wall biosynthesis
MNDPNISVVIPTYNSAAWLAATLDSVLAQEPAPREVVVVDDGSTDGTPELAGRYGDRIRYLRQENFGGPARPRNVGVAAAGGGLIALFDSDDVMRPGKLAAAAAAFAACPGLDLVFSDFRTVDARGEVLIPSTTARYRDFRRLLRPAPAPLAGTLQGPELYGALLAANFIGTSSVVVRRTAILATGGFDESLKNSDDRDMWFRLARDGCTFGFLDAVLHDYRWHEGNVTRRGQRRFPSVLKVLEAQWPHVSAPAERELLRRRIRAVRLGHAWGLRREGRRGEARAVYRRVLAEGWSWSALQGWLLSLLGGRGRDADGS